MQNITKLNSKLEENSQLEKAETERNKVVFGQPANFGYYTPRNERTSSRMEEITLSRKVVEKESDMCARKGCMNKRYECGDTKLMCCGQKCLRFMEAAMKERRIFGQMEQSLEDF
jgi:hypothetical protein